MEFEIRDKYQSFGYIGTLIDIIIENKDIFDSKEILKIVKTLRNGQKLARYDGFTDNECQYIKENITYLNQEILNYKETNNKEAKRKILFLLNALYNNIENFTHYKVQSEVLNSPTYIEKRIEEAKKDIKAVEEELEKFKNSPNDVEALKEKKKEYEDYVKLLENQKENSEKHTDIVDAWEKKIKEAFANLQNHIKPIKDEHDRLDILYKIYFWVSIALVAGLILFEFFLCYKICNAETLPTWEQYFSSILPIPISLGLLWGFITQMNRAQRQMVILAKQIYEIEYIEGLLLTLNTLSVDINESMRKVNEAIDKLIDNHLKYDCEPLKNEESLKCETKKDAMPYETIEKVVKSIMEGYKATK